MDIKHTAIATLCAILVVVVFIWDVVDKFRYGWVNGTDYRSFYFTLVAIPLIFVLIYLGKPW